MVLYSDGGKILMNVMLGDIEKLRCRYDMRKIYCMVLFRKQTILFVYILNKQHHQVKYFSPSLFIFDGNLSKYKIFRNVHIVQLVKKFLNYKYHPYANWRYLSWSITPYSIVF